MIPLHEHCAAIAPRSTDPAEHQHLCLRQRGHRADGEAHRCPCDHEWLDRTAEDDALIAALSSQLDELRLAGLAVTNVQVVLQTGPNFLDDKRRFRIEGELVRVEAETPR